MQHPSQGVEIGVHILHLYIVLPLQRIHLHELCKDLADVLGLMEGSQDLVDGGLGDSEPSGLVLLAHIFPPTTPNATTLWLLPSVPHST